MLLHVSTQGKVSSCDVTESRGHKGLDRISCSVFKARARFDPARAADGTAISGEYRTVVSWGVGGTFPRSGKDISLQVSSVPRDYRSPVKTQLILDASGRVSTCEIVSSSGSAAADRAACTYMKQQLTISPPKSGSPNVPAAAVRYITASLSDQQKDQPSPR